MNSNPVSLKAIASPPSVDCLPTAAGVRAVHVSQRLASLFAALLLVACGGQDNDAAAPALTIYSPAPPAIMLHDHNVELGAALSACAVENEVTPMALPQSINTINTLDADEKPFHLPIVTTIDFLPAIKKAGPDWHAYDAANADLKFVSSLYDVAVGVLVFDPSIRSPEDLKGKRIGAPPRPSAVRVYTEALLRDGWGILDDVEIVDIRPPDLSAAIDENRIDATTWSLMSKTNDGFKPMMPSLLKRSEATWLPVDASVVNAINEKNEFEIAMTMTPLPDESGSLALLSFKQALAAWEATPADTVAVILSCIETSSPGSTALPANVETMASWPGLSAAETHAAALQFYARRGVNVD